MLRAECYSEAARRSAKGPRLSFSAIKNPTLTVPAVQGLKTAASLIWLHFTVVYRKWKEPVKQNSGTELNVNDSRHEGTPSQELRTQ